MTRGSWQAVGLVVGVVVGVHLVALAPVSAINVAIAAGCGVVAGWAHRRTGSWWVPGWTLVAVPAGTVLLPFGAGLLLVSEALFPERRRV